MFILGWAAWPLASKLFESFPGRGYLLAKGMGLILVSFAVWVLASLKIAEFGVSSVWFFCLLMAVLAWTRMKNPLTKNWREVMWLEMIFAIVFVGWSWIKAHEPSINGLEKFMDYGFAMAINNSTHFPPPDIWFSGQPINYYYFGHLMLAVLSKLSTVNLDYGFNLMLATIAAFCFTISYSIGHYLARSLDRSKQTLLALLVAVLVTFSGNLHTIYAFTKGYWGEENPPAFWTILAPLSDLSLSFGNYWYPNATRFIPFTIHEFPSYSFVVSDIHGHVLSIPVALLLIALFLKIYQQKERRSGIDIAVYAFGCGIAFMTNALDGLIYICLLGFTIAVQEFEIWRQTKKVNYPALIKIGVVGTVMFFLTTGLFLANFESFVSGVAVNCPPAAWVGKKVGPLIFETADKCQKSPIWMMLILWGFFVYNFIGLYWLIDEKEQFRKIAIISFVFSGLLILFPEFFYFKDIYPQHFRSNTMFKLGYQAFMLMSIWSGWVIVKIYQVKLRTWKHKIFLIGTVPLLVLVLIYPYFSVKSYFNSLNENKGLSGTSWLQQKYPENWAVIRWLRQTITDPHTVVLEAQGDSYQDPVSGKPYNQISTFTGLPTVAGWFVHEWLWRGYESIALRAADVRTIYDSPDIETTRTLIKKYEIKYIVVGEMEREKYPTLKQEKFEKLGGRVVYSAGNTSIYKID